MKQFVK